MIEVLVVAELHACMHGFVALSTAGRSCFFKLHSGETDAGARGPP